MPTLRTITLAELDSLPMQVDEEASLRCTPAQLFASLQRDEDWRVWLGLVVERTTDGPYREGFTRTVKSGPLRLDEVFTTWNPDEEMGFYVAGTNNPFLPAFAEHYSVRPTAEGCVFRWRIGMEFTTFGRPLGPIFAWMMRRMARKGFPKLEGVALGASTLRQPGRCLGARTGVERRQRQLQASGRP